VEVSTTPGPSPGFPGSGARYAVFSLGCKVSRIDACALAGHLGAAGASPAGEADADVLVVHTCSVTDRADRDCRRLIRRLRRGNPRATLVVSGCLAQRDPDALARMPEVDLVLGHGVKGALPALLSEREAGLLPGKVVWTEPAAPGLPVEVGAALDAGRTRAFLKIQDGCERRCSFCIVPSLRGAERSADAAPLEDEIRRLGETGVPEVVLAGVHLANYGKEKGASLLGLLERLEKRPPACRVRLSSLEPMEAGGALLDFVAASKVVAPHLHLPLQSGSDRVLLRMRRGITAARYRSLVERAHAGNPRIHFATDLITGFPGETEEEFEETLRLVRELPFASLHVFPFSPRSGTRAAELHAASPVTAAAVTRRARALRLLGAQKARTFAARAAGTVADLVTLRGNRGLTDHYLEVGLRLPERDSAPGRRLPVRLLAAGLNGELEAHHL
jgi:threonylcarbamoyladenosine tRNA methylthiotransferase MtaB